MAYPTTIHTLTGMAASASILSYYYDSSQELPAGSWLYGLSQPLADLLYEYHITDMNCQPEQPL